MSKSIKIRSTPSLIKFSVSDRTVLNKKVHTNPRYSHVKSRTNTGYNINRRQEIEREIRTYYKVQPDEVFRRISLNDLIGVIVAYCEENGYENLPLDQTNRSSIEEDPPEVPIKYRDNVNIVVHGNESESYCNPSEEVHHEYPFIIIDVRPHREFSQYRFASSINHPLSKLNRAVSWENEMMLIYKNHPFWIIVLCDDCEDLAPQAAAILLHRGYSNVFVLSGGLKLVKDKIGSPLITTDNSRVLSPKLVEGLKEWVNLMEIPPLNIEDGEVGCWWGEDEKFRGRSLPRNGQKEEQRISNKTRGRSLTRAPAPTKKHWR